MIQILRYANTDESKVIADVQKLIPDWDGQPCVRRLHYNNGNIELVPIVDGELQDHEHVSGLRIDVFDAGQRVVVPAEYDEEGNVITPAVIANEKRFDVHVPNEYLNTHPITQCCPNSPDRGYSPTYPQVEAIEPDEDWTVVEIKSYMDARGVAYQSGNSKAQLLGKIETHKQNGHQGVVWQAGMWVEAGDTLTYNGSDYLVIQRHFTQANWTPDTVPALFNPAGTEIREWSSYASWEFQYLPLGTAVTDNGTTYYLINQGQGHRQPSGAYGHFGWSTTKP
jgi:hypothetical protein